MKLRRMEQFLAILVSLDPPTTRDVWMYPRSLAWFEMVDLKTSELILAKGTFIRNILNEIVDDLTYKDTTMRKAVSAKCRLALTMYYLASTAEYRTIANLFGVSTAFVCICIKKVCDIFWLFFLTDHFTCVVYTNTIITLRGKKAGEY